MKTPQKSAARAFVSVGRNDSGSWEIFFAFLRKESEVARGRSDAGNPDLKKKIERFARGALPPDQVEKACEEFATSPEAMELLARALSKPPEEIPE